MRTLLLLLVTGAVFVSSCAKDSSEIQRTESTPRILKVIVAEDGRINLDGTAVSLQALRDEFAAVAGTEATVWYYRANGTEEPSEEAMQVIQAVMDNQLPISLSSEPDFSTVVAPDGSVEPRW